MHRLHTWISAKWTENCLLWHGDSPRRTTCLRSGMSMHVGMELEAVYLGRRVLAGNNEYVVNVIRTSSSNRGHNVDVDRRRRQTVSPHQHLTITFVIIIIPCHHHHHWCHHNQRECHDLRQRYLLLTSVHSFKALSSFSSMCLKHRCIVVKCLNGLSWFLSMRVITEECYSVLVKGSSVERETCPLSELYWHSLHPKSKQVLH